MCVLPTHLHGHIIARAAGGRVRQALVFGDVIALRVLCTHGEANQHIDMRRIIALRFQSQALLLGDVIALRILGAHTRRGINTLSRQFVSLH